jgi:hypothetical protein
MPITTAANAIRDSSFGAPMPLAHASNADVFTYALPRLSSQKSAILPKIKDENILVTFLAYVKRTVKNITKSEVKP